MCRWIIFAAVKVIKFQEVQDILWRLGKEPSVWKVSSWQVQGEVFPKVVKEIIFLEAISLHPIHHTARLIAQTPKSDLVTLCFTNPKWFRSTCRTKYKHLCEGFQAVTIWPQPIIPTSYHVTSLHVPWMVSQPMEHLIIPWIQHASPLHPYIYDCNYPSSILLVCWNLSHSSVAHSNNSPDVCSPPSTSISHNILLTSYYCFNLILPLIRVCCINACFFLCWSFI